MSNAAESELFRLKQRDLVAAEFIPDYAVFSVDPTGRVSSWGAGAERMLGLAEEEALGRPLSDVLTSTVPSQPTDQLLHQARAEGLALVETMYRRHGDDEFPGSCTMSAIQDSDGQPAGYAVVVRDNTDRVATKTALQQARRNAEIASEMRDLFLSKVSHELRTPLSAIMLWLSLIEDPKAADQAQLDEAIRSIKLSAEEQHQLIETLVDTYRVIAGKFTLNRKSIDLAPLVTGAVERIKSAATEKNISVELSLDPSVPPLQVDTSRMTQVVNVVLDNALKFTPSGGTVHVQLRYSSGNVVLSATDSGVGISGELLPHVFDRFSNRADESAKTHGLGLGLALARQIVTRHGGKISATSDGVGKGSQFTISLPLA